MKHGGRTPFDRQADPRASCRLVHQPLSFYGGGLATPSFSMKMRRGAAQRRRPHSSGTGLLLWHGAGRFSLFAPTFACFSPLTHQTPHSTHPQPSPLTPPPAGANAAPPPPSVPGSADGVARVCERVLRLVPSRPRHCVRLCGSEPVRLEGHLARPLGLARRDVRRGVTGNAWAGGRAREGGKGERKGRLWV